MQIQNANILAVILDCFCYFFSVSLGPNCRFYRNREINFLSAMTSIWSLNPEKAVQEAYVVWREFCMSTSPAPRSWFEIHARRGHGQSTLCSVTGAHEKGRTNLSLPGQGIVSARSLWGHRRRFKPTGCIMSCQVLILFPHTVQHWKHSGRIWQLETFWKCSLIAACYIKDVNWVKTHPKLCTQKPPGVLHQ